MGKESKNKQQVSHHKFRDCIRKIPATFYSDGEMIIKDIL